MILFVWKASYELAMPCLWKKCVFVCVYVWEMQEREQSPCKRCQLDSFMHVFVPLDFPPKHAQISICAATDVKNELLSEDRLFRDKQLGNALSHNQCDRDIYRYKLYIINSDFLLRDVTRCFHTDCQPYLSLREMQPRPPVQVHLDTWYQWIWGPIHILRLLRTHIRHFKCRRSAGACK